MSFQGIAKSAAPFAVETLTSLATVDATGLQLGHRVYVTHDDSYFALVPSTASPDGSTILAVDGGTGLRWRKDGGGSSAAVAQDWHSTAFAQAVGFYQGLKGGVRLDTIGGAASAAATAGSRWQLDGAGTGSGAVTGEDFGGLTAATGATAASRARIYPVAAPSFNSAPLTRVPWMAVAMAAIGGFGASANALMAAIELGATNLAGAFLWLGIDGAQSTANLSMRINGGAGVVTSQAWDPAVAAHAYGIGFDGTTLTAYYSTDLQVTPLAAIGVITNLAGFPATFSMPCWNSRNGADAANRNVFANRMMYAGIGP